MCVCVCVCVCMSVFVGEKMTDEEVDSLLSGVEDNQGQVNYEGKSANMDCTYHRYVYSTEQ